MPQHILFGQLDSNGKNTNDKYNAGKFEGYDIADRRIPISPGAWIEDISTKRTYAKKTQSAGKQEANRLWLTNNYTEKKCQKCFSNIQLVAA